MLKNGEAGFHLFVIAFALGGPLDLPTNVSPIGFWQCVICVDRAQIIKSKCH